MDADPLKRGSFQGVANILRFNWPFFGFALAGTVATVFVASLAPTPWSVLGWLAATGILATTTVSLVVSWYVYDRSGLYTLAWLPERIPKRILNINAGFDETSALLAARYPSANLEVHDFYEPARHTEASIRRARKAYPPYPGTQATTTGKLECPDSSADLICMILSAHEIRDEEERVGFFREVARVLESEGRIVIVEHLRDTANFLAYTIGFFHFHSHEAWERTFHGAGLTLETEVKHTPFLSVFILKTP